MMIAFMDLDSCNIFINIFYIIHDFIFYDCNNFDVISILHQSVDVILVSNAQLFKGTYGTSYVYLEPKIATRGRACQFGRALFWFRSNADVSFFVMQLWQLLRNKRQNKCYSDFTWNQFQSLHQLFSLDLDFESFLPKLSSRKNSKLL